MKIVLYLMTAVLCMNSCSDQKKSQVKYSVLAEKGIKGRVHLVTETTFACDSAGSIQAMRDCCIVINEYNEDGNLIKQQISDHLGVPVLTIVNTLQENGLRSSLMAYKDEKLISKTQNYFDAEGAYAGQIVLDSALNPQKYYQILETNAFGQWVTFIEYDRDSALVMRERSTFRNNLLLTAEQTDGAGKLLTTYGFTYDSRGNLIEEAITDMTLGGPSERVAKYTYDSFDGEGNWLKRTKWDAEGTAYEVEKRQISYRR